jgi:rod shape-determining protein MreB
VFLDSLLGWFSVDMGIDLGTCNTLVCVRGEGIVLNEPSVVAVRKGTNQVLKNGQRRRVGRQGDARQDAREITAVRPLKDGVISDFEITEAMLGYFIRKVTAGIAGSARGSSSRSPRASPRWRSARCSIRPSGPGPGPVYLVEEPMAAGSGRACPSRSRRRRMIVDIGGGTTEVAIMSLADIATCESSASPATTWTRRSSTT